MLTPTPISSSSGLRDAGDPQAQVAVLLALMRDLQGTMQGEAALLRGMRLERLRELRTEKVAIAESYELALRRLRQRPEALAALDREDRDLLEAAMRDFQAVARHHADRLAQAHAAAEDVASAIGESLAAGRGVAARSRPAFEPDGAGRVIAVAFGRCQEPPASSPRSFPDAPVPDVAAAR